MPPKPLWNGHLLPPQLLGQSPNQDDRQSIMKPSPPATCHLELEPLKMGTRGGFFFSTAVASEAIHPVAQTTGSTPIRRVPTHSTWCHTVF